MARVLGLIAGYVFCLSAAKLVFTTLVAYTLARSIDPSDASLQRMGEIVQANQVLVYGAAAFSFVVALHFLHPLTTTKFMQVFDIAQLKKNFPPNALYGTILTLVMVIGTSLGGYMNYLGIYIRFDEVVVSIFSAVVFGASLFALILVEEYILRNALEKTLGQYRSPILVAVVSCATFVIIKTVEFDVGWAELVNLVLLNLTLSMIARHEKSYMASTSFAASFMILVHVLFGLPLMGQDMPGLLLLRGAADTRTGRLLSGGTSGPESGIVLTLLLAIYLYLPQTRTRKIGA